VRGGVAGVTLVLRSGLRHHRRHPLQSLLTLLGIAAGVALLVAMQGAQRTAERAFDRALTTVAGHATHTVTAPPHGLAVADVAALVRELGTAAAPSVHAIARAVDAPGRTVVRVLGIDPLADATLRPWAGAGGGARDGSGDGVPVGELMTRPGTFVAVPALLQRLGVSRGGELRLSIGGRPVVAACADTLVVPPTTAAGLDDVLLVDIATAQEWTGRLATVDRLDLRLDGGRDAPGALATVRERLGAGARVDAAGAGHGALAQLARGFRINLTALSLLSLLVGAFLVHETMRLSVVARTRQLGVLRALGATGGALGRAVAVEALLLGVLGSAAGALLGAFGAQVLLDPLVRTLNDHYATFSLQRADVDAPLLAVGIAVGTGTALLAALGPAFAAAGVSARDTLVGARAQPVRRGGSVVERRVQWLLALTLVLVLLPQVDDLVGGYALTFALVVLATLAVPTAMAVLLRGAVRVVSPFGPFARYTVRSTLAARDHTALPVAAMVLAIATTIGLATLVTSFRDSVAGWLGQVLPGDVYVAVAGGVDERTAPLLPAIAADLPRADGVAATTLYRRTVLPLRGGDGEGDVDVVGVAPSPAFLRAFPLLDGDDAAGRAALAAATPDGAGAWVSEPLAFRWGLARGDPLTIATPRGPATLRIAATYRDYSNERGEVLVPAAWMQANVPAPVTALGLELAAGADAAAVVAALRARAAAAGEQAVAVRAQRELRAASLDVFDRTFAITGVMRLLCLLVAFAGIYAAFAALQLERAAEIGLLRSLGALPSRVALLVVGQTALLGACAGLLALPVGAMLGHVLAHVINKVSFGWSLAAVAVPRAAVGEALALAVGASLLSGLQPAWRFARMRPADALREA
jgi:putative ABC transport system permease protein